MYCNVGQGPMDDMTDRLLSPGPKKGFGFSEIRGHFEVDSKICFWEIFFFSCQWIEGNFKKFNVEQIAARLYDDYT